MIGSGFSVSTLRREGKGRLWRRWWAGFVGLLCSALMVVACSGGNPDADTAGEDPAGGGQGASLVVGTSQEPPNYDYVQGDATAIRSLLVLNVVEPLLERMEDGSLQPLLAESFDVSDDGLQYTFSLREASFHDGSSLNADDVLSSLEYNRTSSLPAVASPFEAVESIEKRDERSVVVTLSQPSQKFLSGMAGVSGLIIPQGSAQSLGEQPVGTGPFVFGEWRSGVQIQLTRFEDYWGDLPYFEDITWRFIADPVAGVNLLLAGDIDAYPNLFGEGVVMLDNVEQQDGFTSVTRTGRQIEYVSLNATAEILQDERIVQAVNHAIDRDALLQGSQDAHGKTTCVFVNPANEPWNSDYCPYPYDPKRSRELLAEAGAEGLIIPYKHLTVAHHPLVHDILASQLTDVGLRIDSQPRELATYLEEVLGESPDYTLTDLMGPDTIDAWTCPGRFTQLCDEEFDNLLARADSSTDFNEYVQLRREAVEHHAELGYLIPLYTSVEQGAWRDNIGGIKQYDASSEVDLRHLHWTD